MQQSGGAGGHLNDGKEPTRKAQGRGSAWTWGGQCGSCRDPQPLPAMGQWALPLETEVRGRDAESRSGVWILFPVFWEATGDF